VSKILILALALAFQTDDDLAKKAAAVKPTGAELAWQKIPWTLDLLEAQQTARAERRPIFLWVTGDDPLERC
jgi:hypothetical protein